MVQVRSTCCCYRRHPHANAKLALGYVLTDKNKQNANPDAVFTVDGDLNANLKTVLPELNEKRQLWTVYCSVAKGFGAPPPPTWRSCYQQGSAV